ncbi:endolytic transglycosylase MltG [Vibrio sp. WJH972]
MFKKLIIVILIALIAVFAGYQYTLKQVSQFVEQPLKIEGQEFVTIESGTSLNRLLNDFVKKDWITPTFFMPYLHRLRPDLVSIKAGTFQIVENSTLEQVLNHFIKGKEHQFAITFVEGSRFDEWREILNNAPHLVQTIDSLPEEKIAQQLGIEKSKLEGLFLAETYHYTKGMSDLDVLKRAHSNLRQVLDTAWQGRDEKLPLTNDYEALTLASIIEKETSLPQERPDIASVFINRLNRGMRLQTDPTVIYGMGDEYDGNIRKRDLTKPTPYNTYVISGLPPTPIAMVGADSISAALNPSSTRYYYFVASGKGGHVFSKSLSQHNKAVRAYLKQLRANK